ncbi:MAG: UDPglucose 6-dehydrogenase [Methanothermococcus sp.]|uniref:UDP-glucose dehydrogenase family protein n=1 Tax=Methanothermococcus TaxID=155862 RepID=UPI000364658B|nr:MULTISPECIES: UDP-glucose/GDP-mannose dehydrogenase family protein [Methanothermococcus]MDK2789605.1 UDPglucose 6-dehydrogenase [Methanothermococcus sp.]MDK2988181.1 UDPglucose 6-dehydrogenase [Methanothermococcus sp.]
MKISVIGTGYVGLIQSVGLAEFGFDVVGIDIDESKVKQLNDGKCPLYEEGLEELLKKHVGNNLNFTTSYEPIKDSDVIFVCVGTPQDNEGNADLRFLFSAVEKMKDYLNKMYKVVVIKSTVPVGTNRKVKELLKYYNVDVVSNPEFLREGIAVHDFFGPERIVLGFEDLNNNKPIEIMKNMYKYFMDKNIPFIITDWESAEMIKYASNAFLATKISFINELSKLSDEVGADIKTISKAMGLDKRIGDKFLNAGIGYAGSCFPKDVKALIKQFENHNLSPKLIKATDEVNEEQINWFFNKIKNHYKDDLDQKTFAVLGLAFKPNTDDLRESRAIKLIDLLLENGAIVKGFDYVEKARENAINSYKLDKSKAHYGYNLYVFESVYETVKDVDGIIIATEYDFNKEDWEKIGDLVKERVIFDGRNILNEEKVKSLGFEYMGVGIQ